MSFRFTKLLRAIRVGGVVDLGIPALYLNLSNNVNVSLARTQVRGNITGSVSGVINLNISPSRTTGIAPLYVNFDMTGTTKVGEPNPTHNLNYEVNFGDSGAGNWAKGVQSAGLVSKNIGRGPVTGHVYETPGTYVVSGVASDATNADTKTGIITVLDPEVMFNAPYGDTVCLTTSGTSAGAPAGSTVYTVGSDMKTAVDNYKASNRRLLFCKGDAWTCSAMITLSNMSNFTIDGYGAGGVAAAFGRPTTMVSVTPGVMKTTGGADSLFLVSSGNTDIKVCNLRINANPTVQPSSSTSSVNGLLYYKVEIRGHAWGWNVNSSSGNTPVIPRQVCFYECLTDQVYGDPFINPQSATVSFASGTPGVITWVGHHGLHAREVVFTGAVPPELTSGTYYRVHSATRTANTFQVTTDIQGAGTPIAFSTSGTCTGTFRSLGGGVSVYAALNQGGIMGCHLDNCNNGEQTMRIPFINSGHINNNYIARPNQSKNILKIHSVTHAYFPVWSEKFVVGANVFDSRGGYSYDLTATPPVTETGDCSIVVGSGGNGSIGGEWVRNGILENNYTYGCRGNPKSNLSFAGVNCPNMTVRNNIGDFAVGDGISPYSTPYIYTSVYMVGMTAGPIEPTSGVRVYNNTLYSNLTNPSSCQFTRGFTADAVEVKNNVWYLPNRVEDFQYGVFYDGGSNTGLDATNNTTSHLTNPNFAAMPPVALTDWRPTSGYAISGGATIPVTRDFNNAARTVASLGAVKP